MSSENNKPIISKAQVLLKEYGHDVKTGHLYEIFSKLAGESSWNVAKVKKTSFLEKVVGLFSSGEKAAYSKEVNSARVAYLKSIQDQNIDFDLGLLVESNKLLKKDFTKEPNAIFVGSLGSGKSVAMANSLVSWVARHKENGLVFLVDHLKGASDYHSLFDYDNVYPILNSEQGLLSAIDMLYDELLARRESFSLNKSENIYDYERKTKNQLNQCVIAFEEFHSVPNRILNYANNYQVEGTPAYKLHQIMRTGRSYGIWVWAASQRATFSEIPANLLSNFVNRFVFRSSKSEVGILLSDLQKITEISSNEKGKCNSNEGVVQFPFFNKEEQKEILMSDSKNLKFNCLFLTPKKIDSYLSGKSLEMQLEHKSVLELCRSIDTLPPEKVLEKLHQSMGDKVGIVEPNNPYMLSLIIKKQGGVRIAVMFRGFNDPLSAKHLGLVKKSLEVYDCYRGIIYTSKQDISDELYKIALDNKIEIIDKEDLIRLAIHK